MADFIGIAPFTKSEFSNRLETLNMNEKLKLIKDPIPSTGKASEALIEEFRPGLYLENAKINSFKMKPENMLCWI